MTDQPTFKIRNWRKFQRYTDRRPKWISIYTTIRDDLEYDAVKRGVKPPTDKEMGQILGLFCVAAKFDRPDEFSNGPDLPLDGAWIKKEAGLDSPLDLKRLITLSVIVCNKLLQDVTELPIATGDSVHQRTVQNSTEQNRTGEKTRARVRALEVLAHLNQITGRNFENVKNILACMKREKCSVEDCKAVIDYKWAEWSESDMANNVNPTSPWRPKHFQDYLDQSRAGPPIKRGKKTTTEHNLEFLRQREGRIS